MSNICVEGAEVSIIAMAPYQLDKQQDKISGGQQNKIRVDGKPALVQADIELWLKSFNSPYVAPPFTLKGTLMGQALTSVIAPAVKTAVGLPVLTQTTEFLITLQAVNPAQIPPAPPVPAIPEPPHPIVAMVKFKSSGQSKFSSL